MIGEKIDTRSFGIKKKIKQAKGFSEHEVLLTHYDTLSIKEKKNVITYFKEFHLKSNIDDRLTLEEAVQQYLFELKAAVPFPGPNWGEENFTFIDLFAGIGGFRIALQELMGKCVFSSEWDEAARETYRSNYGEIPFGDITKASVKNNIPKGFDILCGGFPCQPFSRAGVSARNYLGLEHGFDHPTQGNLFFEIMEIADKYKPKVLFLENVKNLKSHDGGNTFITIEKMIKDLGYSFSYKIINSQTEIPQRRERTYMVCFKNPKIKFEFPEFRGEVKQLGSILEKKVAEKYTISDNLWVGHQNRSKRNKDRGTGFTTQVADLNKPSNTIVARYYKDGKECLIPQLNGNPRMLTEKECVKLFGFPDGFLFHKSRSAAYKQFGNSVAVPVVKKIAAEIVKHLNK